MEAIAESNTTLEDLRGAVEEALWAYEPVRTARHPIETRVRPDGVVEVRGHVRSRLIKDGLLRTLRSVPGVREVEDHLVADPDLELAVAQALASDPRTRQIPPGAITIHSIFGIVTLFGHLPEGVDRQQVVEVVRGIEGVRHVVDRLS